ncbi:type VI secretion system Vgr family protein [Eleftheria terrae]|uniref:type VI secretion system Vgr family protein n=1 Tax=Eleftheria terrae TaxID=1597781 RepID=UPI00263B357E|nr:type VI secretion system Vgr family protein [Eleftheria terrae]WKB50897.1 type VI secretion system tip protein VgrG [Eleftheria terrae]
MNLSDLTDALASVFAEQAFDEVNRPMRMRLAGRHGVLDKVLLLQRIDIRESLCGGIEGHITCLSTRSDLPLQQFNALPLEVQLVTDSGRLRPICGLVTAARRGQSDGSLTSYQLTLSDALGVMERRVNSRVFRNLSVLEITRVLLDEWLQRYPALARSFTYELLRLEASRYPKREFIRQANETDAAFLRRLWKRSGLAWFFRPVAGEGKDDTPRHQLVLFDDAMQLPQNAAGEIRYHRLDGTERRDSITLWASAVQLVPGSTRRSSYDYKVSGISQVEETTVIDQGESGNEFAALLQDAVVEPPHAGDSYADHQRLTRLRMLRHEFEAACTHGSGGNRDQAVGEWNSIAGHPELDTRSAEQRQYITIELHHEGDNNLPKELNDRAQALFAACESNVPGWARGRLSSDSTGRAHAQQRYRNRFIAVQRGTPLVPAWNPKQDLPPTPPTTAIVVGPEGEEVWCDEQGRVKIQFPGLNARDHEHGQGAGTSGTDGDSAWVRWMTLWAGAHYGLDAIPRVGMEVKVEFADGDPDRPYIAGVLHGSTTPPVNFSHVGSLPGNKHLTGLKTKEVHGQRYNQVRADDTPGEISLQAASEHGHSQLNLGYLTHPRQDGRADRRGEGFELRTDESGTIRTAKGLLISAWKRLNASDGQLARTEYETLMEECLELFKTLGKYAAEHQALAIDDKPQDELKQAVREWEAGSNTDPKSPPGGAPSIGVTAPAGISFATPKCLVSYAGANIDTVAQQHLQLTSGQRFNVNAGKGLSLFSHHDGLKAISHHGKLQLQSQHDDTQVDSAKDIVLRAQGSITLMAKDIKLISESGSFIKIDGDITLGTSGNISSKASSFPHSGPATMGTELPQFSEGAADQRFQLLYGAGVDALPAANRRFEITMSDGRTVAGLSDAEGKTEVLQSDAMHIANIRIFKD